MTTEKTTVAELLSAARTEQKIGLKAIASEICVRSSYLVAIEAADYAALPGKTFAIGFVKSYAAALGLDSTKIVEDFKVEYNETVPTEEINLLDGTAKVIGSAKSKKNAPSWLSPILGLIGVGTCWMVFGGSVAAPFMAAHITDSGTTIEEAELASVQATLNIEASDTTGTVPRSVNQESPQTSVALPLTAQTPLTAIADSTHPNHSFFATAVYADGDETMSVAGDFMLEAVEDSWVRIAHENGTEMWSGILREGQSYRPQADGTMLLSTSNAGGVMLQVGTGEPEVLGARGGLVSDLKVEDTRLLTVHETSSFPASQAE